jgi:hypothetical protein
MWVPDSFSFPPGFNELHCSLSIGDIPLLILATQERQCVGKGGGITPVPIEEMERFYSFVPSRTSHETIIFFKVGNTYTNIANMSGVE